MKLRKPWQTLSQTILLVSGEPLGVNGLNNETTDTNSMQMKLMGAASASGVAKGIKKRSRIYGDEHTVMFYLIILAFVDLSEMSESCLFFYAFVIAQIERFSIECRKTKTTVITLANQKGRRQSCKPIKTRSNYT